MQKRNFKILVASIIICISIFWLTLYAFIIIEPSKNIFVGEDVVVVTIKGNVNRELELTVSDIKSNNYQQVMDRTFHIVNAIGREYDLIFSGASLWSIFEEEDILNPGSSTFFLMGGDGYNAETPLPISLAQNFTEQIILAYEQDGQPIFFDGPIVSVIDHIVIPDKANTHYMIKYLKTILIQ